MLSGVVLIVGRVKNMRVVLGVVFAVFGFVTGAAALLGVLLPVLYFGFGGAQLSRAAVTLVTSLTYGAGFAGAGYGWHYAARFIRPRMPQEDASEERLQDD